MGEYGKEIHLSSKDVMVGLHVIGIEALNWVVSPEEGYFTPKLNCKIAMPLRCK